MKILKNKTFIYIITFVLCGIFAFLVYYFVVDRKEKDLGLPDDVMDSNIHRSTSLDLLFNSKELKLKIGNTIYDVQLEDNATVNDILALEEFSLLLDDYSMGYKEGYLSSSITFNPSYTGQILKGDIVLSYNNRLLLYYKDTVTDEMYTKIGHIYDFSVGAGSVEVTFIS